MITFEQHLLESLSSSYPYEVDPESTHSKLKFRFIDDQKTEYLVFLSPWNPTKTMTVAFFAVSGRNYVGTKTGMSSAPTKVFGTIATILRNLPAQYKGWGFKFSATAGEPSRIRLYDRLAGVIAKELNGTVTTDTSTGSIYYTVTPR